MSALKNDIIIEAPADAVWDIVAHRFDRIGEWATAIESSTTCPTAESTVDAAVAGRVCHTGIRAVPQVTETIVAYDDVGRTLTYEATAGMPAFVTLARNRWQVTALAPQRCRVACAARVEVRGLLGRAARWWLLAQVGRAGRHLLQDLKHYVEHGTPSARKQRQLGLADATADPVAAVGVWPTTRRLRAALRADAMFSLVCGVALLAAGWFIAAPWGLGPAVLPPAVGVGVAGFGVLVAWLAVQPAARLRQGAALVVAADAAWVSGSVGLLVFHPPPRPVAVAVTVVAATVGSFAFWQLAGLAAVRGDDPMADVEVVEASRRFAVAPGRVWPLLSDHDLYGRLAPNLSTVEVIGDAGGPLRRRCTNTAGQGWEETCTLWDDGRRFAVAVDTTRYPYPITLMRGLWQVDPHPAGSHVTMRFAYQAAPTVYGGLFAIALRTLFPPVLGRIFAGWQHRLATPTRGERALRR